MFKVVKRDCPMFGIGPYVCEFICDTASDITTLPTSISEGTGGRTVYDNQKCASGSRAIVAENGSESKQYMLNNQDIWCPYSVAAGSSSGGSSESSITVDFALSETSENPVANKVITAALNEKADTTHTHSAYALKSKYGDTTINVGRKEGTYAGEGSTAEGQNTTASGPCSHAEGSVTVASEICSHAEGVGTVASGVYSHSEGDGTTASGVRSHAGGGDSVASGDSSFAHGKNAQALNDHEVAFGQYNISYPNLLFSVGDGTSESTRHNAFDITKTGGYLHNKHIATIDDIPNLTPYAKKTDVPGIKVDEAVNADTLDGHHEDYFAKSNNPSIEGNIYLMRSGNATTVGSIFAWAETVRIRNEDPNAENATYTDLIVTPDGIYTESMTNGVIKGRTKIESGKPYVTGSATVAANSNVCVSNHGFTPSAVIWWDGNSSGVAVSFSDTQFTIDKTSAVDRTINYMIFK